MKKDNILLAMLLICFLVIGWLLLPQNKGGENTTSIKGIETEKNQKTPTITKTMDNSAPALTINQSKTYTAIIKTSLGNITIQLNPKTTPVTVNNFVYLARKNFYDNTIFHRVIPGFMIQGGDPTGTGTGGPGYRFDDEPIVENYIKGTIAMANSGPNTNGSQFFIMHEDYNLPKNYVIFGKAVSGLEVVDKIATAKTQPGGEGSTPVNPVTIKTIEITEK